MTRLIIGYWIIISILILTGGVVSWFQLKFLSREPVSKHLARIRIACSLVSIIFLASTEGIARAWDVIPIFTLYSLFAVTFMAGSLWNWAFYINGYTWLNAIKRLFDPKKRRSMMEGKEKVDDEPSTPSNGKKKSADTGGGQPSPQPTGVTDGPGKEPPPPPPGP